MENISYVNFLIAVIFAVCYSYQFFYIAVSLIKGNKTSKKPDSKNTGNETVIKLNRYAVLISARNEENVLGHLLESIKEQTYPKELIDVFVVADNCTDATAKVARREGAFVYERFNKQKVGKGYALEYLLSIIKISFGFRKYDGYFVFDADNLLDKNYISEMNKTFSTGSRILTSYRNSKNFSDNWISAGYALWFLREARFLNAPRQILGNSCAVSGTGFLIHSDIIEKNNGWKHFLLTEDIEFTIDSLLQGEKIGYCSTAYLYDEQPTSFIQSWHQRMRWAKGYLQVFRQYGVRLMKGIFSKQAASCFDMTMTILPAIVLTIASLLINVSFLGYGMLTDTVDWSVILPSITQTLVNAYAMLLFVGGVTLFSEWKRIKCSNIKKIRYLFTFPLFMFTYIPISFAALFMKVNWKPIQHKVAISITDMAQPVGGR